MIGFLVAGLIIGLLARLILPGKQKIGILWTLALGIAGSLIGGLIANLLGTGSIWELNVIGFVCAVAGSVALLAAGEAAGLRPGQGGPRGPAARYLARVEVDPHREQVAAHPSHHRRVHLVRHPPLTLPRVVVR